MQENLQKDLEILKTQKHTQDQELQNNQVQNFYVQIPHTKNLLNLVKPEEFNQIFEFVDLKSYLGFRLISKRANQTVLQTIPNRIAQIQQIIMKRQSKIQDQVQRKQNDEQGLTVLTKSNINEIKKLAHPPIIVEKVMTMVCILLDQTFKGENSNWTACLKIIDNQQFITKLRNLDIEKITDKQLKLLQNIQSISEEQVQRVSNACFSFYQFIRAVIKIRESKIYQVKYQQNSSEKLIQRDQLVLMHLQKMND